MPPEDDDFSDVVRDTPSESRSEAGIADLARVGQEKPEDQKEKEEAHSEMRKLGKTPSSKDLPQVDWAFTDEGTLVIQFQDKLLLKQVPQDDPILAKETAGAKLPDVPAGSTYDGGIRAPIDIMTPPAGVTEVPKDGPITAVEGAVGEQELEHTPHRTHETGDGQPGDKNGEKGGEKDGEKSPDIQKDAEAIKKATEGLGTDEAAVFKALEGKSPEQIKELKAQFGKGNELEELLKSELSGAELDRAMKALHPEATSGIQKDAQAIKNATEGLGTDEAAVFKALEGKSPEQIKELKAQFGKGNELEELLKSELSGDDLARAMKALNPEAKGDKGGEKSADTQKDAEAIKKATDGLGTDEAAVFKALEGKSPEQIKELKAQFGKGNELEDLLKSELSGDDLARAMKALNPEAKGGKGGEKDSGDAKPTDAGSGAPKGDSSVKEGGPVKPREGVTTIDKPVEADPAKLKEIHEDPKVKAERDALEKDIKNLPPEQQARMKENIEKFEKRAAMQDPPMKPEEVAKTLKEIKLLVETPDRPDQPLNKAERINVADQVLKHAADPTSIDQGANNTCNVSTVEARMFTKEPSKAAEMIRELSINGSYVSHGKPPVTVELDRNKLKAGSEESNNPPRDGERSHASKIFQEGAIAVSHERHGVKVRDGDGKVIAEYPPGSVEYRKGNASPGSKPPNETGEQLIDKKTGKPIQDADKKDIHGPALDDDHIVDTYNDITGAEPPERGVYIVNDNYVAGDGKQVERVKTEEDLKKQLEAAKGPPSKFPIIVGVNTGQEPFFTDSNGGAAGGSGGGHVVTITDYDPKTGQVKMDNQWGKSSDHNIGVHDLHKAMMPTGDAIKELEKDVAKNRTDGVVDRSKDLELLRLKHNSGQMTDAEYDKHVIFVAQQAVKEAQKSGGTLDKQTQEELQGAIKSIQDGKNGETRMQEVRKGLDADVVNRISKQDNPFVGDIKLPDNYATKDMEAEADKIHGAKGVLNDDEAAVYKALEGKSPEEIKQMEDAFQKKHGMPMEKYINSFMDEGPEQEKVKALLAKAHGTPLPGSPAPASAATPPPGPPPKGDAGGGADSRSAASLPEGALANNIGGGAVKGDAPQGPAKGDSGPKGEGGTKGDAAPVDNAKMAADAKKIFDAKGVINDDEDDVYAALEGKNAKQLQAMEEEFKKAHPDLKNSDGTQMTMEQYMKSFMDEGKEQQKVEALLKKARETEAPGDKPGDKPADKPAEKPGNSPEDLKKCEEAKKDLESDIDSKVKDANLAKQMKEQVEKFEKREPPVSAKERAEFYGQIDKLIEAKDPPPRADLPKEGDRQKLALQVLEQASNPSSIDQGQHSTCGTAAMESRLYTKNPAAMARTITEVATTGKLTPQPQPEAGPAVEVHPSVVKPDAESKVRGTDKDDTGSARSYASQVFQGAATTLEREGYRQDGKKSGREGDTGERYKDGEFTGLTGKEVSNIERKLTGVSDEDIKKDPSKAPPIIEGFDSSDKDVSGSQYPGRIAISKGNEAELNRKLQDLKKEGKLPCMIAVDTGQEPFASDSSGRPADGAGGKHFVTITDIDENGNVSIDNQWGSTGDHRPNDQNTKGTVKVSQLSKALGHS